VLEWPDERDFCADSLYLAITGKTFALWCHFICSIWEILQY
jgi:hypothetical protein